MLFASTHKNRNKKCLNTQRNLRIEAMEERRMMAGDVAVDIIGGELKIDGDAAGNAVQVSQLQNGDLEIRGLSKDGGLTRINGNFNPFTIPAEHVQSMDINMGDGDDDLYLNTNSGFSTNKIRLPGNLNIDMEGGDDFLKIQNFIVNGKTDISMDRSTDGLMQFGADYSGGHDTLQINSAYLGNLSIETGGGDDNVDFVVSTSGKGYTDWNTATKLEIFTGDGDDNVNMQNVFSSKEMIITTGDGEDTIDIDTAMAYRDYLFIHSGDDDDTVELSNINFYWNNQLGQYNRSPDSDLIVHTGEGDDVVKMNNVNIQTGNVNINTGEGNDGVELKELDIRDTLFADMGSGDDVLLIDRASAATAELFGGPHNRRGKDTIGKKNVNFGNRIEEEFEDKVRI